jgi:A/G-specific adenine glycosylase
LQRRPPTGIWAALWSLPEAEDRDAARVWFDTRIADIDFDTAEPLDTIAHGFSHYRLSMQPIAWKNARLRDGIRDDDSRWVRHEELVSLGIPAPIRTLLERVLAPR